MTIFNGEDATAIEDLIGIGFGPANIALAAAAHEEAPGLRCRFLEARPQAEWQPGMMLSGVDIQNNPVRDLATLRNPRSRFTFINFLHEQGRLLAYLNVPTHFPLRRDYAQYVRWVAEQFADVVDYEQRAAAISVRTGPVPHYVVRTSGGRTYRGRALVVATGRTPYVPDLFAPLLGPQVFHSSEYRWQLAKYLASGKPSSVAVIGASQSGAEIALDLHANQPDCRIHAVMRGFGYRLKDTSPFSEEAFLPDFTDYYFEAPRQGKDVLDAQLRATNYSSVDQDVIEELYVRRYEDGLDGRQRLLTYRNREVERARVTDGQVRLELREQNTGACETVEADLVVLATGFRDLGPTERDELFPTVLESVAEGLATDEDGTLRVERDYFVPPSPGSPNPPLFLNGLCERSHGLGDAGSFSLLSLRARDLLTGITRRVGPTSADRCEPAVRADVRADVPLP
jgi:L-ornithine N5-monooxygenase